MKSRISSKLDEIASILESKGYLKEAEELDIISNTIEQKVPELPRHIVHDFVRLYTDDSYVFNKATYHGVLDNYKIRKIAGKMIDIFYRILRNGHIKGKVSFNEMEEFRTHFVENFDTTNKDLKDIVDIVLRAMENPSEDLASGVREEFINKYTDYIVTSWKEWFSNE